MVLMNQKLKFLYFRGIHLSLPSVGAKLGYSWIKVDHIADSLLKLQIKIGVHLIKVELLQLFTLVRLFWTTIIKQINVYLNTSPLLLYLLALERRAGTILY